jgi:hypothetical protein
MGWDGMGWDGMGWDGMGWDGMGWDGMGWDGSSQDGPIMTQRVFAFGANESAGELQLGGARVEYDSRVGYSSGAPRRRLKAQGNEWLRGERDNQG